MRFSIYIDWYPQVSAVEHTIDNYPDNGIWGAKLATREQIEDSELSQREITYNYDYDTDYSFESNSFWETWIGLTEEEYFVYYGQQASDTCGPACARMVLRYLTDIAYTESMIAQECQTNNGTYLSDIRNYINDEQNVYTYSIAFGGTKAQMKSRLNDCISNDAPPIIGLREDSSDGWPFNLSSHMVTAISITSISSKIEIIDPWAGYVSDSHRSYVMGIGKVWDAYDYYSGLIGYIY